MRIHSTPTNLLDPARQVDVANTNLFINGNFDIWQRGVGPATVTTTFGDYSDCNTFVADRFFVSPVGASCTVERSATVQSLATSRYSMKITGNTGLTQVDIGQRLRAASGYRRRLTFSCWVYNGTGGNLIANIRVCTPATENIWTSKAQQLYQGLPTCNNASWTLVSYTFDPSSYANIANGLEVVIRFFSNLNSNTKYVLLSQMMLTPGDVPGNFWPPDPDDEFVRCLRYAFIASDANMGAEFPRWDRYCVSGSAYWMWDFPQPMWRAPDCLDWSGISVVGNDGALASLLSIDTNRHSCRLHIGSGGSVTIKRVGSVWFSAELM